jgi:hypothetical protein
MRTLLFGVHALRLDDPTRYDVILGPTFGNRIGLVSA